MSFVGVSTTQWAVLAGVFSASLLACNSKQGATVGLGLGATGGLAGLAYWLGNMVQQAIDSGLAAFYELVAWVKDILSRIPGIGPLLSRVMDALMRGVAGLRSWLAQMGSGIGSIVLFLLAAWVILRMYGR